ncbi:MAG: hypothetical protein ACRELB_23975 [Polyangiaceae bacterium]
MAGTTGVGAACACDTDTSVACVVDAMGLSCPEGCYPDDPDAFCSPPIKEQGDGHRSDYCCLPVAFPSACTASTAVWPCDFPAYPFECLAGAPNPLSNEPGLFCTGQAGYAGGEAYCCEPIPEGCAADPALACQAGATGFACPPGDDPEAQVATLMCTNPVTDSDGNDDYCCMTLSQDGSDCVPDDHLAVCGGGSGLFGFLCGASSDYPSVPQDWGVCLDEVDPDGIHTDFCCRP